MGMIDREWYKDHHQNRKSKSAAKPAGLSRFIPSLIELTNYFLLGASFVFLLSIIF
jgi:hypothetical protein